MTNENPPIQVLGRGRGGVHGCYRQDNSLGSIDMGDDRLGRHYWRVAEGGWIIDKIPALDLDKAQALSLVLNAPMVDPGLQPGEVTECPVPDELFAQGLEGEFQTLAVLKRTNRKWRGLDQVSPEEYAAYWSKAGARVGRRRGEQILWEDGKVEKIEPGE